MTPTTAPGGGPYVCSGCGEHLSLSQVRMHVSRSFDAMAWDHKVHSGGRCAAHSAVCDAEGAPLERSAQFANWLDTHPCSLKIHTINTPDLIAYHVRTVHDLLWVSATVVAPAGLEPQVSVSLVQPGRSTMLCGVTSGVRLDGDGEGSVEYVHLRLGVGDWLMVANGEPAVMRRLSGRQMNRLLHSTDVTEAEIAEARREIDAA